MTAIQPPTYLQAGTYPARLLRLETAAMMAPQQGTGPLAIRGGVKPTPSNTGLQTTQRATPAMFVTIAAGSAFVPSASATGGCYACHNDAAVDVAITAAHATLGRRDLIVARVYDAEISGSSNLWALEAVTGTPAGSPVAPAVPSGAIALATVLVAAAATTITNAAITDSRAYTAALGGTIPAPASALPASPYPGMPAYDLTNLLPKWYSGATWRGWQDEGYLTSAALAASLAASGFYAPIYVIKASDQTRTSSTTIVTDNDLSLPVAANALYWMEGVIVYDADAAGDIIVGWNAPSGSTMVWYPDSLDSGAGAGGSGVGGVGRSAQGLANTPTGGGRGGGSSNGVALPVQGYLQTAGSSGNLTFRWGQATSNAVSTVVRTGSLLSLRRLA